MRLVTLGRVELLDAGPAADALNRRRRKLAVLALLAVEQRPVSRVRLAELFWGGQPEARARHSLSDALSHLRRVLGPDALTVGGPMVQLRPGALAVDALQLQEAAERRDWTEVAALHGGPFLAGVEVEHSNDFDDWLIRTRRRLDSVAATAYARECEALAARGEWASVLRLSARWMDLVPDRARARRFNERAREAVSQVGASGGGLPPARLAERWTRAARGEPGVVIVTGDAETRHSASRALAWRATASGAATLVVRAYEGEGHVPRRIASEVVRAMVDAPGLLGTDAADLSVLAHLAPELRDRCGVEPVLRAPVQEELVRALRGALESIAYEMPCLVVVDDAQLADAQSIRALRDAATAATGPVLLVLSAPPDTLAAEIVQDAESIVLAATSAPEAVVPAAVVPAESRRRHRPVATRRFTMLVASAVVLVVAALAVGTRSSRPAVPGTTTSPSAHRLYQDGVRAITDGRVQEAASLFEAALREDSTFAMAAHYVVHVRGTSDGEAVSRALRLADGAPDRERLLIRATWLTDLNDPRGGAAAETLLIRYPDEIEALVLYGRMLEFRGDFASAVHWLQQAVDRDTSGLRGATNPCHACSALGVMKSAALFAGSFRLAEDAMRRLSVRYDDDEQRARLWLEIARVRARAGRLEDAAAAIDSAVARHPAIDPWSLRIELLIRRGSLDAADSVLRAVVASSSPPVRMEALTERVKVLRLQARHREAVRVAHHVVALVDTLGGGYMDGARILALARLEHEPNRAAAIFDSLATLPFRPDFPAREARHQAWMLTLASTARAVAGDTASLARTADAVQQIGIRSAYGRDHRLHHYIRGLLWEARGDTARAVAEFQLARFSDTETYFGARLARAELATGRVEEAIATAKAALRGPLDSQNQYESRTDLHAILADAYGRAGATAQARQHQAIVAAAWRRGDGDWAVRADRARRSLEGAPRVATRER